MKDPVAWRSDRMSNVAVAPKPALKLARVPLSVSVPVIVGLFVLWSIAEEPVSCASAALRVGAVVSVKKSGSVATLMAVRPTTGLVVNEPAMMRLSSLRVPVMASAPIALAVPPTIVSLPLPKIPSAGSTPTRMLEPVTLPTTTKAPRLP